LGYGPLLDDEGESCTAYTNDPTLCETRGAELRPQPTTLRESLAFTPLRNTAGSQGELPGDDGSQSFLPAFWERHIWCFENSAGRAAPLSTPSVCDYELDLFAGNAELANPEFDSEVAVNNGNDGSPSEYTVEMRVRSLPKKADGSDAICEMRIEIGQIRAEGRAAVDSTGGAVVDENYDFNTNWVVGTELEIDPTSITATMKLNPFSESTTLKVGDNRVVQQHSAL
jgi:hypothetical protein